MYIQFFIKPTQATKYTIVIFLEGYGEEGGDWNQSPTPRSEEGSEAGGLTKNWRKLCGIKVDNLAKKPEEEAAGEK